MSWKKSRNSKLFQRFINRSQIDSNRMLRCSRMVLKHAVRKVSTTNVDLTQSLVKMKRLQAKFQCEDGKPVWLKGGFYDRVLYSTTIVLCFIGIGMDLAFFFSQAKPPSWKNPVC